MFSEKVKRIFALLDVTSADVARLAECDKSHISRMASGARIPRSGGNGAWRLVNGLYLCADEKGKVAELCALISCDDTGSADKIKSRMMGWLYDGMNQSPARPEPPKDRVPYRAFGEKLNAVMELAELSNIRLGKLINLDSSYISRFRNGLRSPKSNPKTMDAICTVLLGRLQDQNKTKQLAKLMKTAPDILSDEDEVFALFRDWLYGTEKSDNSSIAERMLENIDNFSPEFKTPLPSFKEAADDKILLSDDRIYFGQSGLQTAVIRFLGSAIKSGAKVLCLYSDQSMDWMVCDQVFRMKWAALMLECVRHGVHIRIIHNVDRDLNEMIDAITSWLPLYMSGMIESYYCKKQKNTRFSHTLFVCPGVACVEGCNINGQEEQNGIYRYHTDETMLNAYMRSFDGLLAGSKQLVRIYANTDRKTTDIKVGTGMTVLGTTLSLATMPKETLIKMLSRAGADRAEKGLIISVWEKRKELFESTLSKGFVHECIPTAESEKLFGGDIPADIPGIAVSYTPQEYAEHVKNIIALSEANKNYRFYALPDAPFVNTQIVISDNAVAVSRLKEPQVTFMISHPLMHEAFTAYADKIKSQNKQDKITVRQMLERYL